MNTLPFHGLLETARPRLHGWRVLPSHLPALLAHPRASEWTALDMHDARLGDAAGRLAELPALTELTLVDAGVSVGALAGLAPLRPRLEILNLGGNELDASAVRALAAQPLPALVSLDLSENPLGDAGAEALARLEATPEELDLALTGVSPRGLAALVASPLFAGVKHLRLTGNPLGDEGARALTALGSSRLSLGLDLAWTGVGDAGVRALGEAGVLARCHYFDLRGLDLSDECLSWLASLALPKLNVLKLESAGDAVKAELKARYGRVSVNTLDPRWVYACPYCEQETSVHDPVCQRCGADTSRDAGFETTPADIASQPTRPCVHCGAPVVGHGMRCGACRSWVPSKRDQERAAAPPAPPSTPSLPGPPPQAFPTPVSGAAPAPSGGGNTKVIVAVLAGGLGCLAVSACLLTGLLAAFAR